MSVLPLSSTSLMIQSTTIAQFHIMRGWDDSRTREMAATSSLPVPKDQKFSQRFSKLPAAKQELSFGFIKGELLTGRLESVECG